VVVVRIRQRWRYIGIWACVPTNCPHCPESSVGSAPYEDGLWERLGIELVQAPAVASPRAPAGYVAVAIAFADPTFPAPTIAVWEECRHPQVTLPPDTPPKRATKQG
jgi:hypothetical protein